MDTDDLALFLAALRAGSASRAAADLGVSVSTVTRRLDRLEATAGHALVVRSSEGLVATAAGEALRPHAEAAERAVLAGRAALRSLDAGPTAPVRVALPPEMVEVVLLPALPAFFRAHPAVQVVFDERAGFADLMRREADIALRSRHPAVGDELVSTRLRPVELAVYGRPDYLAANPSREPADHRWVGFSPTEAGRPELRWLEEVAPDAVYALRANDARTVKRAAAAGIGLAVLPRQFGALIPTLAEVQLDAPPPPSFELWLVTHRALRRAPGVAELWDWLADRLRLGRDADDEHRNLADALERAYGRGPRRVG